MYIVSPAQPVEFLSVVCSKFDKPQSLCLKQQRFFRWKRFKVPSFHFSATLSLFDLMNAIPCVLM